MGSAIGDYVHLMHINYVNYGTSMYGGKFDSRTQSYAAQKRKNLERLASLEASGIDGAVLDELRDRISNEATQKQAMDIAKSKVRIGEANETISDVAKEVVLKKAQETYSTTKQAYGAVTTGGSDSISVLKNGISASDITANAKSKTIDLKKAQDAKSRVYKAINRLNKNMSSGKKMRQADIKSELQTITRNFNEFFGYLGLASGVKGKSIAQLFNIKADSGCLSALYNFLLQVQYSDTLSKLYGIYGETLGEMANYKIGETANEAVEEAIKDVIGKKGCESSTFEKSTSLASQAAISAMTKSELSMFKAYTTKNKVDATITLQDELGIERDVEASIKAYSVRQGNSYYTPHLEDVDLYSALAATEANFGNHWLNLHVSGGRSFMGDVAQPMDDAFKEQVAYQALASGNLLKTDASIANTFISIDVTSGEVFVKTAADMLKNELNNFNFYPKNFHSIENIVFSNKREESWQRRIAVLLTEINSIKIYTTYKVLLSSNSK